MEVLLSQVAKMMERFDKMETGFENKFKEIESKLKEEVTTKLEEKLSTITASASDKHSERATNSQDAKFEPGSSDEGESDFAEGKSSPKQKEVLRGKRKNPPAPFGNPENLAVIFTGRPEDMDVKIFLWQFKAHLKYSQITEWEHIQVLLMRALRGEALQFLYRNGGRWNNFDEFEEAIINRFTDKGIVEKAANTLPNLYQKTTVQAFIKQFEYWEEKLGKGEMKPEALRSWFIKGLRGNPQIQCRVQVARHRGISLETLKAIALEVDQDRTYHQRDKEDTKWEKPKKFKEKEDPPENKKKKLCTFCKKVGHDVTECRKLRAEKANPLTQVNIAMEQKEENELKKMEVLQISTQLDDGGLMMWQGSLQDDQKCTLCIDTGAEGSIVTSEFVETNRLKTTPIPPKKIVSANSSATVVNSKVDFKFHFKDEGGIKRTVDVSALVLKRGTAQFDGLLGIDWCRTHRAGIKTHEDRLELLDGDDRTTVRLQRSHREPHVEIQDLHQYDIVGGVVVKSENGEDPPASSEIPLQIKRVLREKEEVFEPLPYGPKARPGTEHHLPIKPGNPPINIPPRRSAPMEKVEVEKEIQKLLSAGFIEPSTSPWGSPILFVKKKALPDGTAAGLRMCVDYRALNRATQRDAYPLPHMRDLIEGAAKGKIFSTLDATSSYHQFTVATEDIPKTAFNTHVGKFQFKVMPFGLASAVSTCQRSMDRILEPVKEFAAVFIDDIIIYSETMEEHADHLNKVLEILRANNIHLNKQKCFFAKEEVTYLGHRISHRTIAMDPSKIEAVAEIKPPTDATGVKRFLGMTGFYRRFIKGYQEIAAPLSDVIGKKGFRWGEKQLEAFETLKRALTEAPVLSSFDPSKPLVCATDASTVAVGGVLLQDQGEGLRPIEFMSQKLCGAQRNYPVWELEVLAILTAYQKWRHYLVGAAVEFKTDHKGLNYLMSLKNPTPRQSRWIEQLQEYSPIIKYEPGKSSVMATPDCLSRPTEVPVMLSTISEPINLKDEITRAYDKDVDYTKKGFKFKNNLYVDPQGRIRVESELAQKTIFRELHASPLGGHRGIDITIQKIKNFYCWPTLEEDIRRWTRECEECQRQNPNNVKNYGKLRSLNTASRPNENIAIDFMTDLPESNGYSNLLLIVDRFSRRLKAIPMKVTSAAATADALLTNWVVERGVPGTILSDRGGQFVSAVWKSLQEFMGTRIELTSGNHPQTNALVERVNRTLEEMLRKLISPMQEDWSKYIHIAELAYNTTPHSSTKIEPLRLELGYLPKLPVAVDPEMKGRVKLKELWQIRADLFAKARQESIKASAKQAYYHDQGMPDVEFEVGELVLLSGDYLTLEGKLAEKFKSKYFGPFKVLERLRTSYRLELTDDMKRIHPVFHRSLLRKYNGKLDALAQMREGEIEKIFGHKGSKNTLQLYVKYADEPITACRFEHWYKMDRQMVEEYMERMEKTQELPTFWTDGVN